MASAELRPIYERLNAAPAYHPMSANTFADWSMEAGDIISISQKGTSYTTPVHTSRMTWKGKQQIAIETGGNEERESVAAMSKKKYARGGGGLFNDQYFFWEIFSEDGYLHSIIAATESQILLGVDNFYEGLSSRIEQTASSITTTVDAYYQGLGTRIEQTASSIRSEANDLYNGLHSEIVQTASGIRSEVNDLYNGMKAYIDVTASGISSVVEDNEKFRAEIRETASQISARVDDYYDGLYSYIDVTASRVRTEVADQYNGLKAYIDVTASGLHSEVDNVYGGMRSYIDQTASNITSVVENRYNGLNSRITQTESVIESEVNGLEGLKTQIEQTASSISAKAEALDGLEAELRITASEINSRVQDLDHFKSEISQTASSISQRVEDYYDGLSSQIEQTASFVSAKVETLDGLEAELRITASSIDSKVKDLEGLESSIHQTASNIEARVKGLEGLESRIDQTASSIRSEVSSLYQGLQSNIEQTSSSIRSEVSNLYQGLQSNITQTASNIRSEVNNIYKGLSSSIEQTSSSIAAQVKTVEGMRASIEMTASNITSVVEGVEGLSSKIEQNSSSIALIVGENGAIKIAQDASGNDSYAYIEADKVWIGSKEKYLEHYDEKTQKYDDVLTDYDVVIDGKVAISDLNAVKARVSTLESDVIHTSNLAAAIGSIASLNVQTISSSRGSSIFYTISATNTFKVANVDCSTLPQGVKAVQIVAVPNTTDQYKLQYTTYAAPSTWKDAGTFSRAASGSTEDFTLAGAWSSGKYTVTALPTNKSLVAKVTMPKTAPSETNFPTFIDIALYNKDSDTTIAESTRYTVAVDNNYAYIRWGSVNVARVKNTGYDNGKAAMGLTYSTTGHTVSVAESSTKSYPVTASATVSWDTTNKWFKVYAYANVTPGSAPVAIASDTSVHTNELKLVESGKNIALRQGDSTTDLLTYPIPSGSSDVGLADPTWVYSDGPNRTSNTVSVKTTGRNPNLEKTKAIHLTVGTWASGRVPIYVRDTTTSGTVVAQNAVSLPSATYTWTNTTGNTWRVDVAIGGTTLNSSTKNFADLYNQGWSDAKDKNLIPERQNTGPNMTVRWPSSTVGGQTEHVYTVSVDDSYASVTWTNSSGTSVVVARTPNPTYASGWSAAYGQSAAPTSGSGTSITVRRPKATYNAADTTKYTEYKYYLDFDSSKVYLRYNSATGTPVAQKAHTLYADGWKAAYDQSDAPTTYATGEYIAVRRPSSTSAASQKYSEYRYYLNYDNDYVYLNYITKSGTTVARLKHTLGTVASDEIEATDMRHLTSLTGYTQTSYDLNVGSLNGTGWYGITVKARSTSKNFAFKITATETSKTITADDIKLSGFSSTSASSTSSYTPVSSSALTPVNTNTAYWKFTISNVKTYYIAVDGSTCYANGWKAGINTVTLDPSTEQTLGPGKSVTVKAMGKKTNSSSSAEQLASVTIKARAMSKDDITVTAENDVSEPASAWIRARSSAVRIVGQNTVYWAVGISNLKTFYVEIDASGRFMDGYNVQKSEVTVDNIVWYGGAPPTSGFDGGLATVGVNMPSGSTTYYYITINVHGTTVKKWFGIRADYSSSGNPLDYTKGYGDGYRDGEKNGLLNGKIEGWQAYYDDSADWIPDWDEGNNTYSVWRPKRFPPSTFKGTGSTLTCEQWFTYKQAEKITHTISQKGTLSSLPVAAGVSAKNSFTEGCTQLSGVVRAGNYYKFTVSCNSKPKTFWFEAKS